MALDGAKWEVEYQVKNHALEIEGATVKQTVYVYKCTDSTLQVKDKVNQITLDGCKKTSVVFDSTVAGVDLINCSSCKIMVKSSVQTINIDKCDGVQVILSNDCLDAEIVSAKTSELNIVVPGATEQDEYKEHPIPEQFVSKYDPATGKFTTVCMAHTG